MKIHYNNALNPDALYIIPACGELGAKHATTDRAKVTCKRCINVLNSKKNGGKK